MRLRYVAEYKDRQGRIRRYVRRKGQPLVPLHSRPGTKAFAAEYERALAGAPNAAQLAEASRLDQAGAVYFIDDGACIKIGWSAKLDDRLRKYETHSVSFKLLAAVPATRREDLEWRRGFVAIRKRGDWFFKDPDLVAFISRVKIERGCLNTVWRSV